PRPPDSLEPEAATPSVPRGAGSKPSLVFSLPHHSRKKRDGSAIDGQDSRSLDIFSRPFCSILMVGLLNASPPLRSAGLCLCRAVHLPNNNHWQSAFMRDLAGFAVAPRP